LGHQLKSNEYIIVRVYNVEEAEKNWPSTLDKPGEMVIGQLLVIQGTDVSFFIPPTGLEVVKDSPSNQYVRQAVTLERLEYCILLDEDGNKRYEKGPQVVFPRATEKFITKREDSATAQGEPTTGNQRNIKFKAIELNDQMGLYIKVIADYKEEDGTERKTGEELFLTGKDQRIYYPRPEHAIIEYGSEDGSFKRQRYYGIAIPRGEARYVLDKNTGKVEMVRGEAIFLPDPRHQVIVRRVLDTKTVGLWYPGNDEALKYNSTLQGMTEGAQNYVQDMSYNAAMDLSRTVNRGLRGSSALASSANFEGAVLNRGTKFTPPPSITLNTKYDGPPTINVFTGYAVQVVDKAGNRRVVKGPATILLEYDETLEKFILSTGNPKTTDNILSDVYLRVDHNKISDTVDVETKDMVTATIKLSYRVNFEGNPDKWFAVENYVKFMCDHVRSLLRAAVKGISIKELIDSSSKIVRDTILGEHKESEGARPGRKFAENGMRIYDVEVLKTSVQDASVATMIKQSQQKAVADTLNITDKQQELENTKTLQFIEQSIAELRTATQNRKIELERQHNELLHHALVADLSEEQERDKTKHDNVVVLTKIDSDVAAEVLARKKADSDHMLSVAEKEAELFVKRMATVDPKLTQAIETMANNGMLYEVSKAVAPLAIMEQQGIGNVLRRLLSGTSLADKLEPLLNAGNGENK
jgi:major vault protein